MPRPRSRPRRRRQPAGRSRSTSWNSLNRPETLTVKAGAKVSWTNRDAAPHTAAAGDTFDTGTLQKGDEKTLTLQPPGTFAYICTIHPFMKATVIVE